MSCQLKPNEPQSTIDSNLTKTQKTLKLNIAVAILRKFYSFSKLLQYVKQANNAVIR